MNSIIGKMVSKKSTLFRAHGICIYASAAQAFRKFALRIRNYKGPNIWLSKWIRSFESSSITKTILFDFCLPFKFLLIYVSVLLCLPYVFIMYRACSNLSNTKASQCENIEWSMRINYAHKILFIACCKLLSKLIDFQNQICMRHTRLCLIFGLMFSRLCHSPFLDSSYSMHI